MLKLFGITHWKFKFFPSSKLVKLYVISSFLMILSVILSIVLATQVYMVDDVSYNIPLKGNSTTRKVWTLAIGEGY